MNDETYIINLCDQILEQVSTRQYRFCFLRGDKAIRRKGEIVSVLQEQGRKLPVDAYYEKLNLVIEYLEIQHFRTVKHFDKPHKITVSGIPRNEQRKIYDQRRRNSLSQKGIILIELYYTDFNHRRNGRLTRNENDDKLVISNRLAQLLG